MTTNNLLSATLGFMIVEVKRKLRFSSATIWGIVSTLILFVVQISLWGYINLGHDPSYIVRYFAVVALMRPLLSVRVDRTLETRHASGEIVYDTTRPLSLFQILMVTDIADAAVRLLFVGAPALLAICLTVDVGPIRPPMLPFFAVSLLLAFVATWSISFSLGCAIFGLKDANGVLSAYHFLFPFLSGAMIPLDALPRTIRTAFSLLPFRVAYDLPIRVIGAPNASVAVQSLAVQFAWCSVLVLGALLMQSRSLRRLETFGG